MGKAAVSAPVLSPGVSVQATASPGRINSWPVLAPKQVIADSCVGKPTTTMETAERGKVALLLLSRPKIEKELAGTIGAVTLNWKIVKVASPGLAITAVAPVPPKILGIPKSAAIVGVIPKDE